MAPFDFPTNPPIGTSATTPDGAVRYWDGFKWVAAYAGPALPADPGNDLVTAQNATIARSLANRFADRYSVEDWLTPGQPDGTTDNRAQLQAALDAAAGVVVTGGVPDRTNAPGNAQLLIPANLHAYRIGTTAGLNIPSNSHLIIEHGATIMLVDNAVQMDALYIDHVSNVIVELYGTLDGNRLNQPGFLGTSDGNGVNGGIGGGRCNNIFITGNRLGVVQNFKNWPVNLSAGLIKGETSSNIEVRGISMTDSGNSAGIASINPKVNVTTGSSYSAGTGQIVFVTDAPHQILVGETFAFSQAVSPSNYLQGEYVATAVPNPNEVHSTVVKPTVGSGPITAGKISYCNRCYNVGFVDCYVARIPDLGIVLYSGCTGGYLRGIELTECGSTGPYIFADNAQPASCADCEISGCYVHDTYGSGVGITSNAIGIFHKNSRVFNNIVANTMAGGVQIGAADGAEVFGNTVHNSSVLSAAKQTALLTVSATAIKANVWGNTLRDPNKSVVGRTGTAGFPFQPPVPPLYNSATGQVALQTTAAGTGGPGVNPPPLAHNINPGDTFFVQMAVGTGSCKTLEGWHTADAGTSGSTLYFTIAPGLVFTLRRINIQQFTYAVATSHIVPGTYTSDALGNISVQTDIAHGYPVGAWFVIDQVQGSPPGTGGATDYPGLILNGQQLATTGTTGTTLNFLVTPNSTVVVTNGGRVLPANFGIMISGVDEADASGTSPGTGPDYLRLSGNRMGDYQGASVNMVCAIGGVWGLNGAADGNYFGPRRAIDPDVSDYNKSGVNGFNYDLVYNNVPTNMLVTGPVTFGPGIGGSKYLPPQGLTPSWNYRVGRGEVDFFCGQGGGAPGGFEFFQVQVIHVAGTGSTYDPVTGIVTLITAIPHTVLPGGSFSLNNPTGTDLTDTGTNDVIRIRGSHIANSDTTSTTLTFNTARNMTIQTITGGIVVPAHTGGGLVNTSVGVAGSLLANDGLGNTRLGGALAHGALQAPTLANGGTVTIPPNTSFVAIRNRTSIATGTVVLPAPVGSSYQAIGGELEINFQNAVGALTVLPAATTTLAGGPIAGAVAGNASLNYVLLNSTSWIRRIMA